MRFRTRAFLCCFVPFAVLLAGSFWMIQRLVQSTVRDGLLTSLRENHKAVAQMLAKSDSRSSRFLKVVGENAALKAGMQLLRTYSDSGDARRTVEDQLDARRTVEDQLNELCAHMGLALLMVSGPDGEPLAGVLSTDGVLRPINTAIARVNRNGLTILGGTAYQIASEPIDQGGENLGTLQVGEAFDFSQFATPTVLLHNGHVLKSSAAAIVPAEVEAAISSCTTTVECTVNLRGVNYISLPIENISFGEGYTLRSLQNLDSALGPVQAMLKSVFGSVAVGAVLIALIVSMASSGSIVRPLGNVVQHLRETERTGDLPEFWSGVSTVPEIRQLIESFNRAAVVIREGRENLTLAYVEFIQSLASALDARDPYTAGHSNRVSEMSRGVARAMGMTPDEVERVRVGALLHDIGKIGVPDSLLRKPGRLTPEEFELVMEHPAIGRRILEGVHGFSQYLPAVELHHENWDGTGYPHGQSGTTTPADARIIHVADAYDAMTTDRPYRIGMTHGEALRALMANAGTQFDPDVVRSFAGLEIKEFLAADRQNALEDARVC